MKRRNKIIAVGAGTAAIVGLSPPTAGAQEAASWTASCAMSRYGGVTEAFEQVRSEVRFTFRGTKSGSTGTVTTIDYQFGYAEAYTVNGIHLGRYERGNSSNINMKAPTTSQSGDNLPPVGTWNVPNFSFEAGTTLRAEGILDVVGFPDPSCTASVLADWETK